LSLPGEPPVDAEPPEGIQRVASAQLTGASPVDQGGDREVAHSATSRGVARVVQLIFGNGNEYGLHRRQPRREGAAEMLDDDGKKSLERSGQSPVDHHRRVVATVVAAILQVETTRQHEIDLHRTQLPFSSDRVANVDVEFRPVKCAAAFVDHVGKAGTLERFADRRFGYGVGRRSLRTLARRQHVFEIGEAEGVHQPNGFVEGSFELALQLLGRAKEMRVVLRETAHAREPVHDAGALVAIDGSELAKSQR